MIRAVPQILFRIHLEEKLPGNANEAAFDRRRQIIDGHRSAGVLVLQGAKRLVNIHEQCALEFSQALRDERLVIDEESVHEFRDTVTQLHEGLVNFRLLLDGLHCGETKVTVRRKQCLVEGIEIHGLLIQRGEGEVGERVFDFANHLELARLVLGEIRDHGLNVAD